MCDFALSLPCLRDTDVHSSIHSAAGVQRLFLIILIILILLSLLIPIVNVIVNVIVHIEFDDDCCLRASSIGMLVIA